MAGQQQKMASSTSLSAIFSRINLAELPASSMSAQKLISLTTSQLATNADLAKVILRDYALTNKVLQAVNSVYYSLPAPCTSISQAVNILGFNTIRDLATTIALFESFITSGVEKEEISKLLARSFLSGTLARKLAEGNKADSSHEESFICAIFHNLGKVILSIYLPDKYREIEQKVDDGMLQNDACREVLADLTYQEIGAEVAKFWNLPKTIVSSMKKNPPAPTPPYDDECFLQNVVNFANIMTDCVCNGSDLESVFQKYGERLSVCPEETIEIFKGCVDSSENVSEMIRYGFSKLNIWARLQNLGINADHGRFNSDNPKQQASRKRVFRSCGDEQEGLPERLAEFELPTPSQPCQGHKQGMVDHRQPPQRLAPEPVLDGTKRCLIVDDEQNLLSLIKECLTIQGYHCATANSGEIALQLLARQTFDIMITDIQMGGISGIELTQTAKKFYTAMPVLVMTGFTDTYSYDQVVEAGASDFLKKPFSMQELGTRVARVIHDANLMSLIKEQSKAQAEIGNLMIAGLQEECLQKVKALEEEISRLKESRP